MYTFTCVFIANILVLVIVINPYKDNQPLAENKLH